MNDQFFYENNRFTILKKRIYTILLPVFFFSFCFIFYLVAKERALDLVNKITFISLCAGLAISYLFLIFKKNSFRNVELAVCFIGISVFLLRIYDSILFVLGKDNFVHIGTVSYWFSLVYILLFFTFRGKKALAISLIIYLLTLLPGTYHIFFSSQFSIDSLDTLVQFYIANIGNIVALYFFQKIIEVFLQAEVAQQSANTDYLTGLPNRRKMDKLLHEQICDAVNGGFPISISLFDVDYFKKVNDTYGHDIGDSVLIELANLLQKNVGPSDFIGRWGGEEFLLISSNRNLSNMGELAESLRILISGHSFEKVGSLTCSFGSAELKKNEMAKDLLRRADEGLYVAKENGRNRVIGK